MLFQSSARRNILNMVLTMAVAMFVAHRLWGGTAGGYVGGSDLRGAVTRAYMEDPLEVSIARPGGAGYADAVDRKSSGSSNSIPQAEFP